jgi:pSer/pThr/pTyr-binding forkhead associated (FHA) protein
MSGPDRGKRVPVGDRLTVGQGPQCGMAIPGDTRLSPLHCTVERTDTGFLLVDSGSANGTVVNGQRISEIDLSGGEVIMVGRTVLRFQVEDRE